MFTKSAYTIVLSNASLKLFWKRILDSLKILEKAGSISKLIVVPFIPTAENISKYIADKIQESIVDIDTFYDVTLHHNVILHKVTVWETVTSKAVYYCEEGKNENKS